MQACHAPITTSLPLRGRWHGEAVTEGVNPNGGDDNSLSQLTLTAPSEREPTETPHLNKPPSQREVARRQP